VVADKTKVASPSTKGEKTPKRLSGTGSRLKRKSASWTRNFSKKNAANVSKSRRQNSWQGVGAKGEKRKRGGWWGTKRRQAVEEQNKTTKNGWLTISETEQKKKIGRRPKERTRDPEKPSHPAGGRQQGWEKSQRK